MASDRHIVLAELRSRIARLEHGTAGPGGGPACLPFGIVELDGRLPDGGLRLGTLHEVLPAAPEPPHAAACLLFIAGILARLDGSVLWCAPAGGPFPPALSRVGLSPERVIYAEPFREAALLPLVEEGARFPGLAGVVGEVGPVGLTASRRLQLAAEVSGTTVFLLRRQDRARAAPGAGAALTRWSVAVAPSAPLATPGLGRARWRVALERCRGAPAGTDACNWVLEACDEAGRLALPADLADRSRAQARPHRAAAG